MNNKLLKNKGIQAAIVISIAALLVMVGAFAWSSFTQQRINVFKYLSVPNVNLHDDFAGESEKDVYVENSGNMPVLVRIQFKELSIREGVLLPEGAQDDTTGEGWHVHTPSEDKGYAVCDFMGHEYFTWTMDGHKFYMPAPKSAAGDEDTEPLAVGDLDEIIDYERLLRDAFADNTTVIGYIEEYISGNAAHVEELQDAISALPNGYPIDNVRQYEGQASQLTRELNEVRLTLIPTQIITMQDWTDGVTYYNEPYKRGSFWVMDSDGWCYWASPLKQGEATGQLLSSVTYQNNYPGEDMVYKVSVMMHATTFAGVELTEFFELTEANGGITEDAKLLMLLISGSNTGIGDTFSLNENGEMVNGGDFTVESVTYGENGAIYYGVGDGVYITPVDNSGNPSSTGNRYAISHAGEDGEPGTSDDIGPLRSGSSFPQWYLIDVKAVGGDDVIDAGQTGTLIRADSLEDVPMPLPGVEQDYYAVLDIVRGDNGLLYFKLGEDIYAVALDGSGIPKNPVTATLYLVYPSEPGGRIGTAEDIYSYAAEIQRRYFYHIGSGVYVEVADEEKTASSDVYVDDQGADNTIYYFSSRIFEGGDLYEINDEDGVPLDSKIDAMFVLTLQIGEFFGYYDEPGTGISTFYKDEDMRHHQTVVKDIARTFTMKPIHKHTDGKLYIETTYKPGDAGYIYDQEHENYNDPYLDFYVKGMGQNGEFGVVYFGLMVKLVDGVMTQEAPTPSMGDGSKLNPYLIRSRSEMDWVLSEVSSGNAFEDKHLVVTKDFSMGAKAFQPIGNSTTHFLGTFDGDGKTISDLIISGAAAVGLFGNIGVSGAVENLKLDKVSVTGNVGVGAIAGYNLGTIKNCHVLSGSVVGATAYVGGIVGSTNAEAGIIDNCSNAALVMSYKDYCGGIVGYNLGTVKDSRNTGEVKSLNFAAGIVGYNNGVVSSCENSGTVLCTVSIAGGVVAVNNKLIENSSNTEDVTGKGNKIGGVVGENKTTGMVTGCFNTGGVTASTLENNGYIGGVVGLNTGTIQKSYANLASGKKVYCNGNDIIPPLTLTYAGGIAGMTNGGTITDCYMWGNVENLDRLGCAGGVVGYNMSGSITNAYHSKGRVYGATAGGVTNTQAGTMTNVVALSEKVTTVGANGGRFANSNSGTLTNCYYWSSMPVSIVGTTVVSGTAISPNTDRPTDSWWKNTALFNDSIWDLSGVLPVLRSVTP